MLETALTTAVAVLVIFGLKSLFTKSESKVAAEKEEKAIRDPEHSLKEIVEISIGKFNTDPDLALKFLMLSNLTLEDQIIDPDEDLKLIYYSLYGNALYEKKQFIEAEKYFRKVIEYVETRKEEPSKEDEGSYAIYYELYAQILYILGFDEAANECYKKANHFDKSYGINDLSKLTRANNV